jgi:membrane associated rhomboid family serine protease
MARKNGHDDTEEPDDPKIARFPDARERREMEHRLQVANDRAVPREPILNLPPAVKYLCSAVLIVQVLIQLLMWLPDDFGGEHIVDWIIGNFAFFVLRYTGDMPFGWQGVVSPVTHMFLHGGWLHLSVNMATLAAFGAGLEKYIGSKRTAVIFFVTGILGAATHALAYVVYGASGNATLFPHPEAPLVGAAGGISGLFGAGLMMAQDRGLMGGYKRLLPFVGIWILISVFFGFFGMPGAEGPIAWTVHIGGFIAGLLLYRPIARMKI